MELVDIYADEGISGTKTKNRDDFCRLINDCKNGKIDRVLTKSVSRFARNTVDSIMYARLLKENGVSILFEKENIDTARGKEKIPAQICILGQAACGVRRTGRGRIHIYIQKYDMEHKPPNEKRNISCKPYSVRIQNRKRRICYRR